MDTLKHKYRNFTDMPKYHNNFVDLKTLIGDVWDFVTPKNNSIAGQLYRLQ
jgi:hypothetical protein